MSSASRVPSPVTRTYFGWQRERVAFLFGMSGQRASLLVVATLIAVWPLTVSRMSLAILCWPVAVVLAGLVFIRLGGRTVDEWATAFVSFQLLRPRQQHKFLSGAFRPPAMDDGHVLVVPWGSRPGPNQRTPPGPGVPTVGSEGRDAIRVGGFTVGGYRPNPEPADVEPRPRQGEAAMRTGENSHRKISGAPKAEERKQRTGRLDAWRRWFRTEGRWTCPASWHR